MLLLWSSLALAAPSECPDVEVMVQSASAAFEDAEVDLARTRLGEAVEALYCQSRVVPREALLDLYQLDALASVAAQDPKSALFAIIRAVTLDPQAQPPAAVGPELIEQHRQWAARLRQDQLLVVASSDAAQVWIDGQSVGVEPVKIVSGEHLVQVREGSRWRNRIAEIVPGRDVDGLPIQIRRPPPPTEPDPMTRPEPEPEPEPRRRRTGLAIGVGLGAAAAALVGGGALLQQRFKQDPYTDATYGGCSSGESCWVDARADRIRTDARQANAFFMAGYATAGVGLGVVGIDLLTTRTGAGLQIRGTFR